MTDNKIDFAEKAFLAKDFHGGLKLYLKIIETDSKNSFVQQRIAECYYAIGDYEKSIAACHATLELNSNISVPHVLLAYICNRTNRINESVNEVKTAYILEPDSERVLECYGTILLSTGELDEAISLFIQALSKNPKLISARNNLAIAYRMKGNNKQYFMEMKAVFWNKHSLQNLLKLLTAFNRTYGVFLAIATFAILIVAYIFKIKTLLIIPAYFILEGYINLIKLIQARSWRNAIIYFAGNTSLLFLVYIIYIAI